MLGGPNIESNVARLGPGELDLAHLDLWLRVQEADEDSLDVLMLVCAKNGVGKRVGVLLMLRQGHGGVGLDAL